MPQLLPYIHESHENPILWGKNHLRKSALGPGVFGACTSTSPDNLGVKVIFGWQNEEKIIVQ
jgi:hypothetical protein